MDLLLISLLLFSAFSHVYPSTKNSPYTTQENLPWRENTKKLKGLNDALKRCMCWPNSVPATVHQELDSQNNGQERLVIYLYKNDATNEIKMYTPNANKQMLIPDIPYEAGDGLVPVTTENVYSLLYNNPNKIKVYNDHLEKVIPAVTESLAIGLNTGAIENVYPNADSYLIPNNTYEGNEYIYAKPITNGLIGEVVTEPMTAVTESYDTNNSNLTPEQYWMANNYPYTNPNPQTIRLDPQTTADNVPIIHEDSIATPVNPQSYPYKLTVKPINSQSLPPNPQTFPDSSQNIFQYPLPHPQAFPDNSQDIFQYPLPNPQAFPDNSQDISQYPLPNPQAFPDNSQDISQSPLPNTQVFLDTSQDISQYPLPNSQTFPDTSQDISQSPLPNTQAFPYISQDYTANPQAIPDTTQIVPGAYVGGLDPNNVYTFQTGQEQNKLQPGPQDINKTLTGQNILTFNIWFNAQMKRFQNVNLPSDIKTIDSDTLKILVQKTFLENNIYIRTDGLITDANGIVIDASNLELRPLLLGEKVNYQILRNTKVITLPKHLPYLEGILVTLVSPPQILGIIPLGKTYLPKTSYSTQSLGGLTSLNGSKIYINGIGNSNVASYAASGKGSYTLAYKNIYAGPTKYYAYSEANGLPVAGNANLATYGKVLPVVKTYGNKKPQISEQTYWSSGPFYTASKLPYPTANWNPSELQGQLGQRRKNPDAVIQHHIEQPLKNRKKGKDRKQLTTATDNLEKKVSEVAITTEPFIKINATESGKKFPGTSLASMMQTLLYLLNDLPSRRGLNSTNGADIVNESESDGESPDFRIIGGNAATGSGTPLSNKGRSGVEYA